MTILLKTSLMTTAAIAAFAGAGSAVAQNEEQAGAHEDRIVVTATRREESIQDVPLSVSAFTQATMDKQGVREIDDVSRLTPGLTFQRSNRYAGSQSNITIRGVQSASGIPTTGVYIDDTPIQIRIGTSNGLTNAYPRLFDLERVEVLRGPQGTLFGSGSMGGAVRFITPTPNLNETTVYGRAQLSTTDNGGESYEAGVAYGTPIIEDVLGVRGSFNYSRVGGYIDRVNRKTGDLVEKDANSADIYVGRLALTWQPAEGLRITPSIFFQDARYNDSPIYDVSLSDEKGHDFAQGNALPQYTKDEFYLAALAIDYDFGPAELISNTSQFHRTNDVRADATTREMSSYLGPSYFDPPAPLDQLEPPAGYFNSKQDVFTQEIRLQNANPEAKLHWVFGLFYSKSTVDDLQRYENKDILTYLNAGQALRGQPPYASVEDRYFGVGPYQGLYTVYIDADNIDEEKSAFVQLDYEIIPSLTLTAGVRYTDAQFRQTSFRAGTVIVDRGSTTQLEQQNDPLTPKFGVSWKVDDNNLLYANAAKGFRVGGATTPVGTNCAADAAAFGFDPLTVREIRPDSVWSYEVGSKNQFFGNRMAVDLSAYYIDWTDIQTAIRLPNCGIPTTVNFGTARSQGFDLALNAQPTDDLSLGLNVGYNDAVFTSDLAGAGGAVLRADGEPIGVPPWTFYVFGQYNFPVSASSEGYFRLDYNHSTHDDTPLNPAALLTNPDIVRDPATSSLDLRLGLQLFNGADVSIFGSNLTNNTPRLNVYEDTSAQNYFRAVTYRPRTVGLTVTFRH